MSNTENGTVTEAAGKNSPEVNVVWIDDADLPDTRRRGNSANTEKLYAALESLKQRPGNWARVMVFKSSQGATNVKRGLVKGSRPRPAGRYEINAGPELDANREPTGRSALYARYLGESQQGQAQQG